MITCGPTLFAPSLGQIPSGPAYRQSKNIPDVFVTYKDVIYAGFAGVKTGHMGVAMLEPSHCKSTDKEKYPDLYEDWVFLCIKAWQ